MRDSNPRPRPWQGRALPAELLSHFNNNLIHADKNTKTVLRLEIVIPSDTQYSAYFISFKELMVSGKRWIRTTVVVRQQIYSLPHLATLVSSLRLEPMDGLEPPTC